MADGGIWGRVTGLFRARKNGNDGPSQEEVRERLDEAYRTQSQLLAQVRRGVADVSTSRKRVEIQLASLRREIETAGAEAKAAVDRGDDTDARRALERQVTLEKAATELDERRAQLRSEEDRLNGSAASIERQIEDFRVRKDTLAARYSAAQARQEIQGATAGIGATSGEVGRVMADAERHTRELEATADAVDELMNEGILTRPGESQDEALLRRFDEALDSVPTEPRRVEGDDHGPHQISQ
ncbi:PspA/IM30 family protein [Aeromicrobium duanguangcaii]|uniref:PspA/IM30 family protein n=1 Tax=Aeromicrobium duanguangcaii TaxID=2968086 RepID=A0ABY5KIM3_9ACTN|nr:PspA/IM30 family protein [Aeromicrobium duanguangcaii]MCD9153302.1 PspA/IM30 family protein [Aeromicrobium duanguangcaii]UUI69603.1 PspA/IM30 family protein [Aeromicrobium duanguangcaii]